MKEQKNTNPFKFIPKKSKDRLYLLIGLLGIVVVAALVIYFWQPLVDIFSNQDRVKQLISGTGFFGPFIFIALQFLQVIFAPIPGQVVGFAGGFIFGGWLGAIYSMIGTALGFTVVFLLARRLGRPFVERFVNKKHLDRFDYLTKDKGIFVFFLIFLLPAFPDDLVCYLAGLSKIPLKTLIGISLIGRAPSILIVSLGGAGMADDNLTFTILSLTTATAVFLLAVWKRQQLESFVRRFASKNK